MNKEHMKKHFGLDFLPEQCDQKNELIEELDHQIVKKSESSQSHRGKSSVNISVDKKTLNVRSYTNRKVKPGFIDKSVFSHLRE